MALIKCSECGHDVSDMAQSCPNCGAPIKKAEPMVEKKYCAKCGGVMNANQNFCNHCGYDGRSSAQIASTQPAPKKKDSPTAIVGCAFVLVAFFVFPFLSIVGIICGLIDLGMNENQYRHLGGWVALIMGIIELALWLGRFRIF